AFEAAFDFRPRGFLTIQAQGQLPRAGALDLGDQFRQAGELAGAADDVHVRSTTADQLLVLLRHAAEYAQNLAGMALLVRAQAAQGTVDFVLGVLADAASIEQDDVGFRGLLDQFVALAAQAADDQLAVEHVHLAADGFYIEFFSHSLRRL